MSTCLKKRFRGPHASTAPQVIWLLEELGLNYTINSFRFDDVKKAPFINVNPNGRVPAIEDPNTDLTQGKQVPSTPTSSTSTTRPTGSRTRTATSATSARSICTSR